uniref:Major facilitator superfamily associated domain-containing protein n=1 Tax=Globisporangium ultimum (strain ATCC 200006 / CBS 805.95 / DAOM BR144) TaxID=431595 RepID=K3WVP4_GLOUD
MDCYETPAATQRKDMLTLDMSPRRATRVTIIVPSPSPNEVSASLEHIKLHTGDDYDTAEADDSTEAMLEDGTRAKKTNRKKKTAPVDMHAFRTCIILGMPWAAYAVFSTIFHDVRASYMTSMGISDKIPRFVPPLVTFFLGPILGAASDRSLSKWGRRNAFLMFAVVILTVSGLLFGSAQVLFAEYTNVTCLLLFLLSIGVLLINIGLRARIMDEVPIEYQVHAQSAVAMWDGVGGALGLLLFRNTAVVVFASEISGHDILVSFSAAMAGILVLTAACIYLRPEPPQDRPPFQPPLARLVREVWDQILYAPMLFRKLCLVHFVLFFAWSSFKDEIYNWWGSNVYSGCKDAGCSDDGLNEFKHGLDIANSALMCQNALQVVMGLIFLFVVPRVPNASFLKRGSLVGLIIGELALVICVSVGKYWLPLTFGAFVATAFYQTVVTVFPYAVVGIMGKEIQESAHSFNNNGLYIGVLMLFSSASELTVQIYGAEKIAPLGTGNLMTLSCILFAAGIACTTAFTIAGRRHVVR